MAEISLPFASAKLRPCVEFAITHGPAADDEVLDWVVTLAQYWRGLGADEESVARDIESWYTQSETLEDLNGEDIRSFVKSAYISDRSRVDCSEMYQLQSFKAGCVKTDCVLFNPPTKDDSSALPTIESEAFKGPNGGIYVADLGGAGEATTY